MRKLLLILSLGFLVGGPSAYALDDVTYDNVFRLNVSQSQKASAVRILKLVRNPFSGNDSVTISSGDAVVYDSLSDDGITVTSTTTSGDNSFAGIAAMSINSSDASASATYAEDAGRRNWGWIVVHGPAIASIRAGGSNLNLVGDLFITSSDALQVTTLISFDSAHSPSMRLNPAIRAAAAKGGFFFDAAGTGPTTTSMEVFVENT